MLESLFTNVFGKPKNKSSTRNSQDSSANGPSSSNNQQLPGSNQMTGPFSASAMQMPQPPNLPYPIVPPGHQNTDGSSSFYPPLPFSKPPAMPEPYNNASGYNHQPFNYPTGTLTNQQTSPLDSVPFEFRFSSSNSSDLVSLDQLFKKVKDAANVVERADAYLQSGQSDYDFKVEQSVINQ